MDIKEKYTQIEIDGIPKKRGGWRGGGRPIATGQTTVAIRIPKELNELVNILKEELKNGNITKREIEGMIKAIKDNQRQSRLELNKIQILINCYIKSKSTKLIKSLKSFNSFIF